MKRLLLFFLSLCLVSVCCVGFSSVNKVYAASTVPDSDIYTYSNVWYREASEIRYLTKSWSKLYSAERTSYENLLGYNTFPSKAYDNVGIIALDSWMGHNDLYYNPLVYDYYVLVTAYCDVSSGFTFKPDRVATSSKGCESVSDTNYLTDLHYYHHCSNHTVGKAEMGFTIIGKLPELDNTNLQYLYMYDDDSGSVPSGNIHVRYQIVPISKDYSSKGFESIIQKLDQINTSINDGTSSIESAIDSAADQIQKVIEDQYSMNAGEDFGVSSIVDQVEDKMGVLSFGSDTLVGFLDLFNPDNATNTILTFPEFKMTIQGEEYSIWSNINYNLESLEESFGSLITAVRWATVAMVWIALLNYLVKAFDHIINKGAR